MPTSWKPAKSRTARALLILRWANLAAFSEATDLFRFRCIPDLTVTADQFLICDDCRYDIVSVEDVKGCGMYIEVLAKKEVPTVGKS